MNSQITRKQHYIPRCYLKSWKNKNTNRITVYDKLNIKMEERNPKSIFYIDYYYEIDKNKPDNKFENKLSELENKYSSMMDKIHITYERPEFTTKNYLDFIDILSNTILSTDLVVLKEFALFMYFRVPDAITQKTEEVRDLELDPKDLEKALVPCNFVEFGVGYMENPVINSSVLLSINFEGLFITSDRPCFDVKDADTYPVLAEDYGSDCESIIIFPLSPYICANFLPSNHKIIDKQGLNYGLYFNKISNSEAKNINKIIINRCDKKFVSQKHEERLLKFCEGRMLDTRKPSAPNPARRF